MSALYNYNFLLFLSATVSQTTKKTEEDVVGYIKKWLHHAKERIEQQEKAREK